MYGHVSRFLTHPDQKIIDSLNPILGGPGWQDRLDKSIPKGPAVEKLFRETLKGAGNFDYVISTKIDKSTQERPHFFLAYGTKDRNGLKAFRDVEYKALHDHARNRSAAMTKKRETRTSTMDMFAEHDADQKEASIDDIVAEQKILAKDHLKILLTNGTNMRFTEAVDILLQMFMLRETNVKDICVELTGEGKLQNTWGNRVMKPSDQTILQPLLSLPAHSYMPKTLV
jgi:hypothetical protein